MQNFNQNQLQQPTNSVAPQKMPQYKRFVYFVLRNPWIFFASILVLLTAVFTVLTPQQNNISRPPIQSIPIESPTSALGKLQTVRFIGDTPEFPDEIVIYSVQPSPSGLQRAAELANLLGLKKVEDQHLTTLWENAQTKTSLFYDENFERIRYSKEASENEVQLPPIEIVQATTVAQAFINTQLRFTDLVPQANKAIYISHESAEPDPNNAEAVTIPFVLTQDGFPIKYSQFEQPLVEVTVSRKYEVLKAVFYPTKPLITPQQTVGLLNVEQAIGGIRTGSATITSAYISEGSELVFSEITTLELNTVELEYRIHPQQRALVPYFMFSGTALTTTEEVYDVTVITPAIDQPSP